MLAVSLLPIHDRFLSYLVSLVTTIVLHVVRDGVIEEKTRTTSEWVTREVPPIPGGVVAAAVSVIADNTSNAGHQFRREGDPNARAETAEAETVTPCGVAA